MRTISILLFIIIKYWNEFKRTVAGINGRVGVVYFCNLNVPKRLLSIIFFLNNKTSAI